MNKKESSSKDFPKVLINIGARLHEWGKNGFGSIEELQSRVEAGWVSIDEVEGVVMHEWARIDIFHNNRARLLVEDEYVGIDETRAFHARSSAVPVIACPIRLNENTSTLNAMMLSLLKERFRFLNGVTLEFVKIWRTLPRSSGRYPGLMESGQVRYFECDLPDRLYEQNGYTWRRHGFIIRYQWLPLMPTNPRFKRYST
jgi:hypothetical protein